MARIAKGIKGIRKTLTDNNVGWHVWILLPGEENSEYHGYMDVSLNEILKRTDATLTGVTGNGLFFNI